MRGAFLCVEGIDGAGKSAVSSYVSQRLEENGIRSEQVHDPGTAHLAKELRPIILNREIPMSPMQQTLLYTCARSALANEIKDKIASGITIVADRWMLSTVVYQGFVGGVDLSVIANIHNWAVGLMPDCYVLLDVDAETGLKRKQAAGGGNDRFENVETLAALREKYLLAAREHSIPIVDTTTGSLGAVQRSVWDIFKDKHEVRELLDATA